MKNIRRRNFLKTEEVLKFHNEGWCGPFDLMSESKMSIIKNKIFSEIINPGIASKISSSTYLHNRHLDNDII